MKVPETHEDIVELLKTIPVFDKFQVRLYNDGDVVRYVGSMDNVTVVSQIIWEDSKVKSNYTLKEVFVLCDRGESWRVLPVSNLDREPYSILKNE